MRFKINSLRVFATMAIGLSVLAGTGCRKSQSEKAEAPKAAVTDKSQENNSAMTADMTGMADTTMKKMQAETGYYTCTMHPLVHKTEPGNCPICGMKLVFRENEKKKK